MSFVNENFDILGVQFRLENEFKINRQQFHPEVFLYQVNEPEFGCEGRPEGKPAYAELYGYTLTGTVKWLLSEQTLQECGLFDYMWVGTIEMPDGTRQLISWREGTQEWKVLDREKWEEKLPVK